MLDSLLYTDVGHMYNIVDHIPKVPYMHRTLIGEE